MSSLSVDLLLDPFGADWTSLRDAALVAEEVGFGGIWTWDHLAGQSHNADRVLECWTVLSALAVAVPRVALGPLVLNVANRRPAVLATMAATLQEVSGGRLLLGIGAGGGRGVPYPAEQIATGHTVPSDPIRRRQVREAVEVIRQLWTGRAEPYAGEHYQLGTAEGFIVPDPPPPIIIGAFGPKMAAVAGQHGDGINTHAGVRDVARVIEIGRAEHAAAGGDRDRFLVTLNTGFTPRSLDADRLEAFEALGADRIIMLVHPPFDLDAIRTAGAMLRPHAD